MSRPWFKVFREKLAGSPRVRALKPWNYGVYMHLMVASNERGALVSGNHPWTIEDVCVECNVPKGKRRVEAALERLLHDGLLHVRSTDGAYVVSNFCKLQETPKLQPQQPSGRGPRRAHFGP